MRNIAAGLRCCCRMPFGVLVVPSTYIYLSGSSYAWAYRQEASRSIPNMRSPTARHQLIFCSGSKILSALSIYSGQILIFIRLKHSGSVPVRGIGHMLLSSSQIGGDFHHHLGIFVWDIGKSARNVSRVSSFPSFTNLTSSLKPGDAASATKKSKTHIQC